MENAEKKIRLSFAKGACAVPSAAFSAPANAFDFKLLLLICDDGVLRENFSVEKAAGILSCDEKTVETSLDFWYRQGILSDPVSVSNVSVQVRTSENGTNVTVVEDGSIPHYTGEQLRKLFESDTALSGLVDECQRMLGKMFTPTEACKIIALSEYYRMPHEYVLTVVQFCKEIGKASVPYVFKTAVAMQEEGIDTTEALVSECTKRKELSSFTSWIRGVLGIGARRLTAKEERFIGEWQENEYPRDMIVIAYEVAVDGTGAASMPYMNKVLTNWREAGYKTAKEAVDSLEEFRKKKQKTEKSFDIDRFFEAALARSESQYSKNQ